MKKDKLRSAGSIIIAVLILVLTLTACGKSEFSVSENTGKQMTVTAQNADKDAFFMVGSLDVADGEQIVITSNLTKGSVRVDIVAASEEQSIDKLPDMNGDAIITAELESGESVSGTVAAGSYLLRATCLKKATGTIQIEVKPADWSNYMGKQYTGQDPWGNRLSVTLKGITGNEVSFAYETVIGEGEYTRTFLTESSGEWKDGTIPFHVTAAAKEYEAMHLDYSGRLTLKDGSLFVTYDAGSVMEESTEGGSAGYQALGLEGEDKTVELRPYHSDSEDSGLTPAGLVDSLFASGDITLTLYLANDGECNTYPANEWYSGRFTVLLNCYNWTKLEMPSTEPSEVWLTAASADGTVKMTFWYDGIGGMVQYSDGSTTSFWRASPKYDHSESIARDIRMEYDNLDVDSSRISFSIEGTAEDAADYFVHTAFSEHMTALEPGSIYGISDYEVVQWTIRETSENGDAVVGSFEYAFTPWDFNSPGIWAGNTAEGTGDYEGKLTCYREFVLQRQEDGSWHCTGLGTGGYTLPEQVTNAALSEQTTETTAQTEAPSGAAVAATEAHASTHRVEVADQSVSTFMDYNGGEYKTIIPKLIVDGKEADSINAALRDHINRNHPLTQDEYGVNGEETRYAWGVRGDIVSIIIITDETFTDGVGYDVFNYNVDTLQAASNDEVIKAFGMTADEYCGKVADAYKAFWDGRPYLHENMSDLDRSIGAISLANITPFITPDGNLGAAGRIYVTDSQFPESVKCFNLETLEIEHFAEE